MRATQWARVLLGISLLAMLIVVPVVIWQMVSKHSEQHFVAWIVSALFVFLACTLSVYAIAAHLMRYQRPELQRYVVRILFMVPLYSVESWLALRFKDETVYLETARECYEAYVIYNFFMLMQRWLAPTDRQLKEHMRSRQKKACHHLFPFCCLRKWKLSSDFLWHCHLGVMQYVVVKLLCTLVTFVTLLSDHYGEGEFTDMKVAYPYVAFVTNASQLWAMYVLVLFYHESIKELRGLRPLPKLLSVKLLVFVSFWQGIVISAMVALGYIKPTLTYSEDEVAAGLQDFLICIEMALLAIAHHFIFTWRDFADDTLEGETPLVKGAVDILPMDMFHAAKTTLQRPRGSTASDGSDASGEYAYVPAAPASSGSVNSGVAVPEPVF